MSEWNYASNFVIRKPSNEEQFNANIDTSDYQISGLTIQSKILNTLGLCPKIYRSKFTTVQYSNKRTISRFVGVVGKALGLFTSTEPASVVISCRGETTTALTERFGINLRSLLSCPGADTWDKVMKQDYLLPLIVAIVKGNHDERKGGDDYEPSEELVRECKEKYVDVFEYLKTRQETGMSLKKFILRMCVLDGLFTLLEDDIFNPVRQEIMDFEGTVGELKTFVSNFLTSSCKSTERGYSRTVLEEETLKAQEKINRDLERDNLKFNFEGFKYWLNMYRPEVVQSLKDEFDLSLEEHPEIQSFEDLAKWFYEPDRMHAIRESLGVKVRARTKGDARQGVRYVINAFNYGSKIKTLNSTIGDFNEADASQRLKDLKARLEQRFNENEEAKKARHEAIIQLHEAKKSKDKALIAAKKKEYEEIVHAATVTSKLLTATKKAFKKAEADLEKKKTAIEQVREYREKYGQLIDRMKKTTNDEDRDLVYEMEQRMRLHIIEADTIPYSTWTFKAYCINEDVIRLVTEELERAFSNVKGRNGEPSYINVTSYAYLDEEKNAVSEFHIDYPTGNKLYKAFSKNPNLSKVLIEGIDKLVHDKLGYYVDFGIDEARWNVDMNETLWDGGDPLDSWDA